MRPLDGRITPGGEPEPTEAEFFADMDRVDAMLNTPREDTGDAAEDSRASLSRAEALESFVKKHRRRIERYKMPVDGFLKQAARLRADCIEKQRRVEKATEDLLQAQANVAEKRPEATELVFRIAHEIHSKWETMDEEGRERWRFAVEDYEQNREVYLSDLPIEDRRRLEEKYPKWW